MTLRLTQQQTTEKAWKQMNSTATERHYTIAEISAMWSLSRRTIRRILDNEPGILALGHPGNEHRQRYQRLRVPESVLRRIYDRMRSQ
jgi:hypothetical protein